MASAPPFASIVSIAARNQQGGVSQNVRHGGRDPHEGVGPGPAVSLGTPELGLGLALGTALGILGGHHLGEGASAEVPPDEPAVAALSPRVIAATAFACLPRHRCVTLG
jgi:hypothetical protein